MKNILFFLISTITVFGTFSIISCGDIDVNFEESSGERIEGNGDFQKETRAVSDFDNLQISHFFNVVLEQGDYEVVVEAASNHLEYIITEVQNNTLKVKRKKGVRLKSENTPKIRISMPDIKEIHFSGAGTFKNKGVFDAEDVSIHVSGGTEMDLNFECQSLSTSLSGAADFDLKGSADKFYASTSGAGSIDAEDFITEFSSIQVSGAADVKVHATELLEANISGIGSIRYAGEPKEIKKQVSGLGSIKPI